MLTIKSVYIPETNKWKLIMHVGAIDISYYLN